MRKAIIMHYSNSEEVQYNEAEILKINADGSVDANVFFIEDEQIIRKDNNLTFPADYFQFTSEELEELGVRTYTEFEEAKDLGYTE